MKNILVPVDGSEYSKRAMEKAAEIAKALGSKIVLINVKDLRFPLYPYESGNISDMGATINQLIEAASKNAKKVLNEASRYFEGLGIDTEQHELDGDPGNRIVLFVEENEDIDLVVMGSLGVSGGLQKFLLGSVTSKVLHRIKKPVLVVK
ncbi:universal stress protein [Alkalibacter mobilis]|uniref:universal stress protein n=1 Tax=Alkalibacter mobilis TaxID=2787712 RepID=UPI00189C5C58|nr:universal stress protein [Alkalibacter mobilis]MBF7097617.1 universal stress protein [Alkalibacter mobilis]